MKTSVALTVLALASCGGPELSCPNAGLPDPNPTYTQSLSSLVVVPTRAPLRDASEAELESFAGLAAELQAACEASPPASECELTSLRARLRALPAPEHPDLFTGIDDSLDAAITSSHTDYAPADRDCDGQPEAVCDARGVTMAFVRAACELGAADDEGEHS